MTEFNRSSLSPIDADSPHLEMGSFAPPSMPEASNRFVIATFNIRYAVGSFLITGSFFRRVGLTRPDRRPSLISRNIQAAAEFLSDGLRMPRVDILALQEADKQTARAGRTDVACELAKQLQMHYAHASLDNPSAEEQKPKQWYLDFEEHISSNDDGKTGLAVLSRIPFVSVEPLVLPWTECAWRPRLALKATVRLTGRVMNIYNAHIDPHATTNEQLAQHSAIIASAAKAKGPTVILGDFNTLTSVSRASMRRLLESSGYTTPFRDRVATWRAGLIRLQPDWIFVREINVARCGVAKPLSVSDHWPVWAELELNTQQQRA